MRKLIFFFLILGLYTAGWFAGALYLEHKINGFQILQSQKFREFSYKNLKVKGFPLQYAVHFDDLVFKGPVKNLGLEIGGDLNIDYTSQKCVIKAKIWNWRTFTVVNEGQSRLHLTREAHPGLTIDFQKLEGKIFLNHHRRVTQFDLKVQDPTLGYFSNSPFLKAEQASLDFRHGHQITATDRLAVDKIDCAFTALRISDKTCIQQLRLQCNILNPFSRGSVLRGLKIWRDDGGIVEIPELSIQWKNTTLKCAGTLSLDEQLRPLAGMTVTVTDYNPILEAFVTEKWLKPKEALAANIALALLKKSASNTIEIPLSIQDGALSIGPLIFSPIPSLETMLKI